MLLPIPFQNLHKILLHVDVDRAVAGEGATGHVAAGDLVDWDFNLCSSHGVELGYEVGHSCFLKDDFDVIVVSL